MELALEAVAVLGLPSCDMSTDVCGVRASAELLLLAGSNDVPGMRGTATASSSEMSPTRPRATCSRAGAGGASVGLMAHVRAFKSGHSLVTEVQIRRAF